MMSRNCLLRRIHPSHPSDIVTATRQQASHPYQATAKSLKAGTVILLVMRHHSRRPTPATYPVISTILPGRIQTTLQSLTFGRVYAVTRRTSQLIQTVRHSISAAKSLLPLSLSPLPESYSTHKRDESVTSLGPPVSLHNSSFRRHTRNRASNDSGSSIAHAYSNYGANGGRAVWAKHQSDASVDSIGSDFSAAGVARPGLGDKMFSSAANYCGAPLTSILASPSASDADMSEDRDQYSKSDSMIDHRRSSGDSDSFLKPSDVSDASIFGAQVPKSASSRGLLFGENAGNQRRPLSVFSSTSISSSANVRDDDTMISMLGGGHVSRKAVDETFSASPCFKSKPRKKQPNFRVKVDPAVKASAGAHQQPCNPNTALASQPSSTFGKRRMALASQGLLERHSLEDTVLSGDGSDNSSIGAL